MHDMGRLEGRVGHGREGVSNSIQGGRWKSSCVSPGPALMQDKEEDTVKEHGDKAGELEVKI